jgi:hypothetical protein
MSDEIVDRANSYKLQSAYVGRGHYLAAEAYAWQHRLLGIPVVVGSAALASSIFARSDSDHSRVWNTATGVVAAAIAVLAALQTFLRLSERSEEHKTSAVKYGEVRRTLEIFELQYTVAAAPADMKAVTELELVADRLGHLAATSPHLPAKYYRKARDEQRSDAVVPIDAGTAQPSATTPIQRTR